MIPDGLEPSFPGCKPEVVAAGPRDHDHLLKAEAVRLELTSEMHSPPVFKTGSSSSRMTSMNCGGRNRTCGPVVQSNGFLPSETTPHREECPVEIEPAMPGEPACPAWKAGTFAARPRARVSFIKAEAVGLEPTSEFYSPPVFKTGSSASRITPVENKAAVAGIEPASGRLTVAFPYQHRTHCKISISVVGFEPTISCSQGTRIPRLSHTLLLNWFRRLKRKPKRPAGVEPAHLPWQSSTLPLHHGR